MPRRIGIHLLVEPPQQGLVDGLRRALADPSLGVSPAHCTIAPPTELEPGALETVLARLWQIARDVSPIDVQLGAPVFDPAHRFLYLPLTSGGEHVHSLHDAVCKAPLRGNPWSYLPHVTIAAAVDPRRAQEAVHVLAAFECDVCFDALVVRATSGATADRDDWREAARFALGPWGR